MLDEQDLCFTYNNNFKLSTLPRETEGRTIAGITSPRSDVMAEECWEQKEGKRQHTSDSMCGCHSCLQT